ncbi:hypothetical protein HanHA300_Chr03g0084321 [Helianthus annuus]|nr:hypothetical protein HanHA300_Chr03g0084321 [Helianthus annuus]KAJ0607353.1 hypothetical protein HanHA89_Chr03g0095821 [Helianthus annuus]KAJ0767408.1 hypothetical protein HanLR1_Chr03g0089081 [Helianthus annuus]
MEEEIMSEKRHNQIAYLDPEEKLAELKDITKWIRESRINYAVTFSTPVYKSLIKAFWDSANVVQIDGKDVIRGRVNNLDVIVSPDILNEVLQLKDNPDAPDSIPIMCTRGCLLRMKCTGDIFSTQINKGDLPLRYKFLLHVLIQCLSNRRAGYDMAGNDLVGLMVALVLNKPFSISRYIFGNMKENLTRTGRSRIIGNKFWMYPRFLQMVMSIQHPGLPKADNDVLKIEAMNFNSLRIIKNLAHKRYKESNPPRKLFGALGDTAYVAPKENKWRHNDSESDDEEPELKRRMSEKFGPDPIDSDSSGSDSDDEGGDGGDTGVVGASSVGTTGGTSAGGTSAGGTSAGGVSAGDTSAGGDDEAESDSDDDHLIEPGYEMYFDERGVKRFRRIRQEDDPEYVPSDSEAERLRKRKAEKSAEHQKKKKARRYLSTSTRESVPHAPVQEPPVVSAAPETQTVSPQAIPQRSIAEAIRATTSQPSAATDRIQRQTDFIRITKNDQITHQVDIDKLKSNVGEQQAVIQRQQAEIDQLKDENVCLRAADEERERRSSVLQKLAEDLKGRCDFMKDWYESRNTTIAEGVKKITGGYEFLRKRVATLWEDRCKQQEIMQKRDEDPEDQGNPDPSATSQQPPATTSSAIVVYQPSVIGSSQGTSSGTVAEEQLLEALAGTSSVPSSADLALQVVHPVTGEFLEEGEIVEDLSHQQLITLKAMRDINDDEIEKMPSEPESTNFENIDEIVFEGDVKKSSYVRQDGTEFAPFDEDWLKDNVEDIDEHLKNRDTSENATDAFSAWHQRFLSRVSKPVPEATQVDYLQLEKGKPSGRILC